MVMKLALCSGKVVDPLGLLATMTSRDIGLWQAFDKLNPFGQHHTDFLIAQLSAICFNMWKDKSTPPVTIDEMLGIQQELTEEYVMATLRSFKNGTN